MACSRLFACSAILIGIVLVPACGRSKDASTARDFERPPELGMEFDAAVERAMTRFADPGLAIGVVKDNRVAFLKGYGMRDRERSLPVTPDTLFGIASCTKAFTGTIIGMLKDEGRVDLDRPIKEYLANFQLMDPVATSSASLRDLMLHRTGLPRHDYVWWGAPFDRHELLRRLRFLEPTSGFRNKWQYQNMMFLTTGLVAEAVTGQTWDALVAERIFEPLGMSRSRTSVRDLATDADHATPYAPQLDGTLQPLELRNIDNTAPAGAINASVADMAKWLLWQLGDGKLGDKQLLVPETFQELHTPQGISQADGDYPEESMDAVALGWEVEYYRGYRVVWHTGAIDGFRAFVGIVPSEQLGVVVLANSDSGKARTFAARTALDRMLHLSSVPWEARLQQTPVVTPPSPLCSDVVLSRPLAAFVGEYLHPGYGLLQIIANNEHLRAVLNGVNTVMHHCGGDAFQVEDLDLRDEKIVVGMDAAGKPSAILWRLEPDVAPIEFKRGQVAAAFATNTAALTHGVAKRQRFSER